jgi:hypothetical protein
MVPLDPARAARAITFPLASAPDPNEEKESYSGSFPAEIAQLSGGGAGSGATI